MLLPPLGWLNIGLPSFLRPASVWLNRGVTRENR